MPVFFRSRVPQRRRRQWLPPGRPPAEGAGTAAGLATVTAAGDALKDIVGTAAGLATVSGVGEAIRQGAGLAAGLATVAGVIEALTGVDHTGVGVVAGVATAAAIGQAATTLNRELVTTGPDIVREDELFETTALPQAQIVTGPKPSIVGTDHIFQ